MNVSSNLPLDVEDEFSSGDIDNGSRAMMFNQDSNQYVAKISNLKLKKIRRTERRGGNESVTDEKFSFLFRTKFDLGSEEFQVQ